MLRSTIRQPNAAEHNIFVELGGTGWHLRHGSETGIRCCRNTHM